MNNKHFIYTEQIEQDDNGEKFYNREGKHTHNELKDK